MAGRLFLAAASLALVTACSSTGSDVSDVPSPVQTGDGDTSPQRNLLLSDLSYGSPGQGRAINETFELAETCDRLGYSRYWLAEHHNAGSLACASPEVPEKPKRLAF